MSNQLAESVAATTNLGDGMFYGESLDPKKTWNDYVNSEGGYVGPTKLYPGYKDPILAAQEDAAAINAKYGIGGMGSIGKVEVDTSSGAIPVKVESTAPSVAIGQSSTSAAGNVLDSSQPNLNSQMSMTMAINQASRDLSNTMRTQAVQTRTVMQAAANSVAINMLSDSVMIANATSSSANAIIGTLYAIFGEWAPTQASSVMISNGLQGNSMADFPSYANGGYVSESTIARVGDAPGGEYIIPAMEYQRMFERQAMNFQIDGGAIQKQISNAIGGITIEPVVIPTRVVVDFDSSEIQAAIHRAIAIELESVRI